MKMRRRKHRQARLSREQRALVEWRAEFRRWNEDFERVCEKAAVAISDFIFNASEAWKNACTEAATALQERMAHGLMRHAVRERG